MLIDQQNRNILSLFRELFKGSFDGGVLCLRVDDEVVLLRVGRVGNMLCDPLGQLKALQRYSEEIQEAERHTPTPASRIPVTESWEMSLGNPLDVEDGCTVKLYLISYDCEKLSIFVCGSWKSHGVVCVELQLYKAGDDVASDDCLAWLREWVLHHFTLPLSLTRSIRNITI